jgi:uncharacterized protein YfaS (alpha-2-macroglobulin family)
MAVLPEDTLAGKVVTTTGGRLTSQVQEEALLLNVLIDLDKGHPWIPVIVQRLEKARTTGWWGNTLENATAIAALARYQMLSPGGARFEGAATAGGTRRPFDQAAPMVFTVQDDGKPIEITSTGEGDIYVSLVMEGLLRESRPEEYDRRLVVTRAWTNRKGEAVDPVKLKVGDLVMVETRLSAPGLREGESVENVAIVDALPGGLEVENPRLVTSDVESGAAGGKEKDEASEPERAEFRDDRVLLFTSATKEKQVFRYALRVVTAGTYAWPAVQASCMYDAGYASMRGAGTVVVGK